MKSIFFVAGVSESPIRHCVWGFFHTRKRAIAAAENNETDINEAGYYPYALVTEAAPGLANLPVNTWWFAYESDTGIYRQIPRPDWTLRYGWMGFPEASQKPPSGIPIEKGLTRWTPAPG